MAEISESISRSERERARQQLLFSIDRRLVGWYHVCNIWCIGYPIQSNTQRYNGAESLAMRTHLNTGANALTCVCERARTPTGAITSLTHTETRWCSLA